MRRANISGKSAHTDFSSISVIHFTVLPVFTTEKVKSAVAADLDLTIDAALQLLANPNAKASEPVDLDELSLGQIMQLKLWRIDPRINLLPLGLSLPEI